MRMWRRERRSCESEHNARHAKSKRNLMAVSTLTPSTIYDSTSRVYQITGRDSSLVHDGCRPIEFASIMSLRTKNRVSLEDRSPRPQWLTSSPPRPAYKREMSQTYCTALVLDWDSREAKPTFVNSTINCYQQMKCICEAQPFCYSRICNPVSLLSRCWGQTSMTATTEYSKEPISVAD